jgi:accessory gene regulator protein AgrB
MTIEILPVKMVDMKNKHALIMLACCLIPIAGLVLISLFNIPLKSAFYYLLILSCPVSHLLMMKYMVHDDDHQLGEAEHNGRRDPIP